MACEPILVSAAKGSVLIVVSVPAVQPLSRGLAGDAGVRRKLIKRDWMIIRQTSGKRDPVFKKIKLISG